MKNLLILIFIFCLMNSLNAQYKYGLEICEQDIKINGKIDLNDGSNILIGENSGVNIDTAGSTLNGVFNTFVGVIAGQLSTTGRSNTFIGHASGFSNTIGIENTFVGANTGSSMNSSKNTFVGHWAANNLESGNNNTMIGESAGLRRVDGCNNVFFGQKAGIGGAFGSNANGDNNTYIGYSSGHENIVGSNNIFIGFESGYNELGSDKLVIENSRSSEPLVYGEFDTNKLKINGSMKITEFANLQPRSDAPSTPEVGTIYYDSHDNKVKVWTGIAWENLN